MLVAAVIAGVAVVLLMATLAPRLSPLMQAAVVVMMGYVLGYDVWHADAGPIPLTLDRIGLAALVGFTLWRFWRREIEAPSPIALDWLIALLCGWLTISCLLNKAPDTVQQETSPLFRLIVSFWAPAALYAVLRTSTIDAKGARQLMTCLAGLGFYLGVTAVLETFEIWSLVFPRYIADPELGLHFGRARGPALNSVSMGMYLAVCAAASWLLIPKASRPMQVVWLAGCVLMSFGTLLSMTRSTWAGLAAAAVTIICLQLPKHWRRTAFIGTCLVGGFLLVVGKDAIVGLEREDSAEVSAHSAQQRLAFIQVSDQMFRDNPLWGVGFGRFYDKKLPYLTDRRQWFELESIRPLHHHNTFLSVLVETGMLGLFAFLAVLYGLGRVGWQLAHDPSVGAECNRLGLLLVGAVVNYLPSAAGHDLTLVHSEQWLLLLIGGAATGCWISQRRAVTKQAEVSHPAPAIDRLPTASPVAIA